MNKEAGTPGALNKVHRLGTEWEAGKSTGKNPNKPTVGAKLGWHRLGSGRCPCTWDRGHEDTERRKALCSSVL